MYRIFAQALLAILVAVTPFINLPAGKLTKVARASSVARVSKNIPTDQNAEVSAIVNAPTAQPMPPSPHAFGNPAGCAGSSPNQSAEEMLAKVQEQLPDLDLSTRRLDYIYNGMLDSMVSVGNDPFVYEFSVNLYRPPFTYLADQAVTIFLQNGFAVWLRNYGGHFRLTAIPMVGGVYESNWGEYVRAYWSSGLPKDKTIYPVMKKLPCHWMIDEGWVNDQSVNEMFGLDWGIPDYLTDGRQYLTSNCEETNRISQEQIGYWDAASMCGPLAWTLLKNANSFPYRIGSWYASSHIFEEANPKWNGRPWAGFDPETYDVFHTDTPMPGYDFAANGNMEKGDIIYSYSTLTTSNDERFEHIFLVADVNGSGERISITNMVQNKPEWDCSIREVVLYTPGDTVNGVINKEWNSEENGRTGLMGFDIFRWKWVSYHLNGQPVEYIVRTGDTLETIAFDWKVSPQAIADNNQLALDTQLTPGQKIMLPALSPKQGAG